MSEKCTMLRVVDLMTFKFVVLLRIKVHALYTFFINIKELTFLFAFRVSQTKRIVKFDVEKVFYVKKCWTSLYNIKRYQIGI